MIKATMMTSISALLTLVLFISACTEPQETAMEGPPAATVIEEAEAAKSVGTRLRKALREAPEKVVPQFEARSYGYAVEDTMRYRLMLPLNYDQTRSYPLVVCLAGATARGDDNVNQVVGAWAAHVLAQPDNRDKYPCFVLVPQCPQVSNWGYSVPDSVKAKWEEPATSPIPEGVAPAVFSLIDELSGEFNIDGNRVYVTGHAMGGYGTWHFIITRPDLFAAAVPVAAGADSELAEAILHVPVWAFHGEDDGAVPIAYSRDIIEAMRKAGANPRYTVFPGARHLIWPLAYDDPELLDWIFAQTRSR